MLKPSRIADNTGTLKKSFEPKNVQRYQKAKSGRKTEGGNRQHTSSNYSKGMTRIYLNTIESEEVGEDALSQPEEALLRSSQKFGEPETAAAFSQHCPAEEAKVETKGRPSAPEKFQIAHLT
jgi:hypothetical protein